MLSQAAGAVVGACSSVERSTDERPLIGMTSLGSSTLKYMIALKPEIEKRGFELAVFLRLGNLVPHAPHDHAGVLSVANYHALHSVDTRANPFGLITW